MEILNQTRQILEGMVKAQAGLGKGQRLGSSASTKSAFHTADIMGLPVNLDEFESLQVLDAGANFGKFYFLAGFSQVGGSDILR